MTKQQFFKEIEEIKEETFKKFEKNAEFCDKNYSKDSNMHLINLQYNVNCMDLYNEAIEIYKENKKEIEKLFEEKQGKRRDKKIEEIFEKIKSEFEKVRLACIGVSI